MRSLLIATIATIVSMPVSAAVILDGIRSEELSPTGLRVTSEEIEATVFSYSAGPAYELTDVTLRLRADSETLVNVTLYSGWRMTADTDGMFPVTRYSPEQVVANLGSVLVSSKADYSLAVMSKVTIEPGIRYWLAFAPEAGGTVQYFEGPLTWRPADYARDVALDYLLFSRWNFQPLIGGPSPGKVWWAHSGADMVRIEARIAEVPEPTLVGLIGLGVVGIASRKRR